MCIRDRYTPYVNFAISKGFVKEGQFDNYDRPAKRREVAVIFENAMPDGYFTAQNDVTEIPDVSESRDYRNDLLTLYKAGVVMGSDAYGNFRPEDNITRAESAAIINRVAPVSYTHLDVYKRQCWSRACAYHWG